MTTKLSAPVDKRGERVKEMFAGVAPRYDLLNHLLSMNIDRSWRTFTIKTVPISGNAPILDVCTGTGDLALGYAAQAKEVTRVIGVDFCPPMLERARAKAQKAGLNVEFLEADAMALPFPDNQFQIVSVAFGLRNVADTRAGLREMIRVAQPGGRVAILEFSKPNNVLLRWMYLAYFKYLLPWVGQAVSRNAHAAYHYLPASVLQFPCGNAMVELLQEMGLHSVKFIPLTFGIATLYIGNKPDSSTTV